MLRTTNIRWRQVDADEAKRNRIGCATFGYCGNLAAYCREWKTESMSAPAFYYYCAAHAAEGAAQDGIALEILPDVYTVPTVADAENPYRVGSVWHTSWGYDQTNVEFLQVVRESKASVWLAPMGSEIRNGRLWPTVTTGLSDAVRLHRKPRNAYGIEHPYLTLDNVRSAWPYDGGGKYDTRAAGQPGH